MPIKRVYTQPEQLVGFEYFPGVYEWFEVVTESGEVYAVFGITLDPKDEMWLYWRILKPSVAAWRDLKRCSIVEMRRYAKMRGKKRMVVQTRDPNDVNYQKMVELMGFCQHHEVVVKTSWQEV